MRRGTVPGLLWLAGVLALAAVGLSAWVAIHGTPLPGDVRMTQEIQTRRSFGETADLINFLGWWNWVPLAGAAAAVLFRGHIQRLRWRGTRAQRAAIYTFMAAAALRFFDQLLKLLLESPRPVARFGVRIEEVRSSYGFPSGHVYSDVLLFGAMAVFAPVFLPGRLANPLRVVLLAVILLAGPARVYVGAHWPSDTIGGYLWGGAALCLATTYGRWAAKW